MTIRRFRALAAKAFLALGLLGVATTARAGGGAGVPPGQGPDLVLRVVWEESGSNGNGSWKAKYDSRFRPAAIWTGSVGGGVQLGGKWALIGGGKSPEFLYKLRGSLLGLEVGEKLQYYLSEANDAGSESQGKRAVPMSASLSRNGQFSITCADGSYAQDDLAYRKQGGIPSNENFPAVGRAYHSSLELQRTKDGVTIVLGPDAGGVPYSGGPAFPSTDLSLGEGVWKQAYAQVKTFKLTNDELKRLGSVVKSAHGSGSDEDSQLSVNVTLSFTPDAGDEVEVTVDPEDGYDRWLPRGRLEDPAKPGNGLLVRFDAHKKGDAASPRKVKLDISLPSVSKNKGVCMNWPRKSAAVGEGLRFRPEDFKGDGPLVFVDSTHVRSKEPVAAAEVLVHAYDYGAWGTLHVTARDDREREAGIVVRGQEKHDLAIPLDENDNHVADAWEVANVGDLRKAAADDGEKLPAGKPGTDGDGLSLYEEYRGFRVKGDHVRTDPKRKDLFVCDHTDGQVAQAGIDLFERATQLSVRRVDYEELGSDRVINRNGGDAHVVDQHGLLIESGVGGDPRQVPVAEKAAFGPPKQTLLILLPAGTSYANRDGQADAAHELCHGVGIRHHGEPMVAADWRWRLEDGRWVLYEQPLMEGDKGGWTGNPKFPPEPIQVFWEKTGRPYVKTDGPPAGSATVGVDQYRLIIAGEESPMTGDQECLLRYADKQAFFSARDPRARYLPDKAQWKMRTRLCGSKEGTGVNAPGHQPQPRYGPAIEGNCQAQLVVSDKYAE
jgi:hypothetical protein